MVGQFTFKDGTCIPMKHANIIRKNWLKGLRWNLCSPVFVLKRSQVAEILASNERTE